MRTSTRLDKAGMGWGEDEDTQEGRLPSLSSLDLLNSDLGPQQTNLCLVDAIHCCQLAGITTPAVTETTERQPRRQSHTSSRHIASWLRFSEQSTGNLNENPVCNARVKQLPSTAPRGSSTFYAHHNQPSSPYVVTHWRDSTRTASSPKENHPLTASIYRHPGSSGSCGFARCRSISRRRIANMKPAPRVSTCLTPDRQQTPPCHIQLPVFTSATASPSPSSVYCHTNQFTTV